MNRKILSLVVIVVSILICVFNILSGTLDNFLENTVYINFIYNRHNAYIIFIIHKKKEIVLMIDKTLKFLL